MGAALGRGNEKSHLIRSGTDVIAMAGGEREKRERPVEVLRTGADLARNGSEEADALEGDGSLGEGKWGSLDADVLVQIFGYLQGRLWSVMLVSKHWEQSAREGSCLWKKVRVSREWETKGRWVCGIWRKKKENDWMSRVLGSAEEVTFWNLSYPKVTLTMLPSVEGMLGPLLRVLELPAGCVSSNFFPVLCFRCPKLQSLVMKGEPHGKDPINIFHPKLTFLELECVTPRCLTITCPALTHLSTIGDYDCQGFLPRRDAVPPSLRCPRLTKLCLPHIHSTSSVLESLSSTSPNIEWLEVECYEMWPCNAVTLFESLRVLKLYNCTKLPSHVLVYYPRLKRLLVNCISASSRGTAIELYHGSVRELYVSCGFILTSPTITCALLEELTLRDISAGAQCLLDLDSSCPSLKRVKIHLGYQRLESEELRPVEISHERVEVLEVTNPRSNPVRITCPKLTKLAFTWNKNLELSLKMDCPNLTTLRIDGYHMEPGFLSTPSAVLMSRSEAGCYTSPLLKEALIEHSHIENVVISRSDINKLVFVTPRLVNVNFVESTVQALQVASRETVTVIPSTEFEGGCRVV